MVPGVLLEPYMSQGDQGVAETPIVSKGLINKFLGIMHSGKVVQNMMQLLIQLCRYDIKQPIVM